MKEKLILGIHLIGHDLSISLLNNEGKIIFIAEEEKYSGIKGGSFIFSPKLIRNIFAEFNTPLKKVRFIAVVGEPDKWPPKAYNNLSYNPSSRFYHKSLWENELLAIFPNVEKLYRINHHLAHAACAFYSSKYEDSCVITMDAYGDNETASICHAQKNQLKKVFSVPFYHSHVYLYEAFAIWLGLRGREKAGKLMGLSSYGQPKYLALIQSLFDDNTPFFLSDAFSKQIAKAENWTNIIEKYIGRRNTNSSEFNQYHQDIASSIQNHFENITLELFQKGRALVPSRNICCAGGGFYNSVSNGKLIKSNLFDKYYFHPIAGDSGLSLGAAQLVSSELGFKRSTLSNICYGSKIDSSQLKQHQMSYNYNIVEYSDYDSLISNIASKISNGYIIGWCQSNMEIGPRALGNRSILADPRDKNNIKKLNRIKKREQWRPFASSVLYEDSNLYFDINSEYPYMNIVATVLEPNLIPASCHIDGTARIQTVKYEENGLFYNLISAFKGKTGIGVLLNTSLNIQGKPIARSLNDCLQFFETGQVDIMVIDNFIITNNTKTGTKENIENKILSSELTNNFDSKFNLLILSPDKNISSELSNLKDLANEVKIIESELSIGLLDNDDSLSNSFLFPINEQLVVLLPWYKEVFVEMMPLLMKELNHILNKYPNCLLIDIEGKIFSFYSNKKDFQFTNRNMTEVEEHYLRIIQL
ncbi:MAG: hypothetical protein DRR16_14695 [Candidatus Parabeggiatoa sp. nov. 3]|nr:MAG: hypothetical protein DRR00_04900 [Gammaproteobacteria bacterium]RKZ68701.1 MAG: hypothetical protein DRQ99_02990 [Gammaproteobacteria bacterium]RKZ84445.1 MAG: hypothetical protein DRR16_14695 [Gammaproteobacteria bacterium]